MSKVELVDDIRLPKDVKKALKDLGAARERADREQKRAGEATMKAVQALLDDVHLSVRDAASLLGISFHRVQQLAKRE